MFAVDAKKIAEKFTRHGGLLSGVAVKNVLARRGAGATGRRAKAGGCPPPGVCGAHPTSDGSIVR
jgi:hypothetical protein